MRLPLPPATLRAGRADFRRDDFHGPDAVAHLRGDRAERLAAALRALAGIADDLDDVLAQRDGGLAGLRGA